MFSGLSTSFCLPESRKLYVHKAHAKRALRSVSENEQLVGVFKVGELPRRDLPLTFMGTWSHMATYA